MQKVQVWVYFKSSVTNSDLFLVLQTTPARKSFWQPVTGGVEPGEWVEAAALREAQEETGLTFAGPVEALGQPFQFESRGHLVTEFGFSVPAQSKNGEPPLVRLDSHEHVSYRWVSANEALQMVAYPSNAEMLKLFLTKKGQGE